MKLPTEQPRRMLLALTDEWQTAGELAEVAGIAPNGAGTVLLACTSKGLRRAATAVASATSGDGRTLRASARTDSPAAGGMRSNFASISLSRDGWNLWRRVWGPELPGRAPRVYGRRTAIIGGRR
jgi:hypothetical protein